MDKKQFLIFLLLPLLTASTYTVKDGAKEVISIETHDGSSEEEVISEAELNQKTRGYTKLKASELKQVERNKRAVSAEEVGLADPESRENYFMAAGITERDVENIATAKNMGIPNKSTEYSAGETYPMRTWSYEFEAGGLKHFHKVYFNSDGKVLRSQHQTENL